MYDSVFHLLHDSWLNELAPILQLHVDTWTNMLQFSSPLAKVAITSVHARTLHEWRHMFSSRDRLYRSLYKGALWTCVAVSYLIISFIRVPRAGDVSVSCSVGWDDPPIKWVDPRVGTLDHPVGRPPSVHVPPVDSISNISRLTGSKLYPQSCNDCTIEGSTYRPTSIFGLMTQEAREAGENRGSECWPI